MDSNKRMILAVVLSLGIFLTFNLLANHFLPKPVVHPHSTATHPTSGTHSAPLFPQTGTRTAQASPAPRVTISAPDVKGSISLRGAKIDQLVLTRYHTTVARNSPLVTLLSRPGHARSYFVQFGWDAPPGATYGLPTANTIWTASSGALTPGHPITLHWTDPQQVTFKIILAIDQRYMFTIHQTVSNASSAPITAYPWSRIRRDYLPKIPGSPIMHKGPLGVFKGTLHTLNYVDTRSNAKHQPDGAAFSTTAPGGWAGITGKYWLTALIPTPHETVTTAYRYRQVAGRKADDGAYQVDMVRTTPLIVAPGGTGSMKLRVFTGAKVLSILNAYGARYHIPSFDKAIDFGILYLLTKPMFLALNTLGRIFGNFGIGIVVFTIGLKLLLFPLVRTSFLSMAKMRDVAPKVAAVRERIKDDLGRQQKEIMALYKLEGVNPAAGCVPMLLQIPIFFALYKVIFITIEMRHAPFFLWIHDLSARDPTNVFNLFGLLPFHPTALLPLLHVGVLPILMGLAQFGSQRLNPPPADPAQARIMKFMPVIYTVMLASFPAGLVLYYTTNNFLTMVQQWIIMKLHHAHRLRVSTAAEKLAPKS